MTSPYWSVTAPPVVRTYCPSSSIKRTNCPCDTRMEFETRAWTRGEASAFSETLRASCLVAAATGADPEALLVDAIRQLEAYGAGYRLAQARLALASWLAGQGRGPEAEPLLDAAGRTFAELKAGPMLAALSRTRQLTDA